MSGPGLPRLERDGAAAARGAGGDGGGAGRGRQPVVGACRGAGGAGGRSSGRGRRWPRPPAARRARWSSPPAPPRRRRWRWPGGAARARRSSMTAWRPGSSRRCRSTRTAGWRWRSRGGACCRRRTRRPAWCRSCRRGSPASTRCRRWGGCPSPSTGRGARAAMVSAHKLGGPKGVGALLLAPGAEVAPVLQGRRAGDGAAGRAPRTWSGSPASARRSRRRRRRSPRGVWEEVAEVRNILEAALASAASDDYFCRERRRRACRTPAASPWRAGRARPR